MFRLLFAACLVSGPVLNGGAIAADSFSEMKIAHHCDVVRRLERIYATGDPAVDRDSFLAVSIADQPQIYVQCIFQKRRTMAYCEAVSGHYLTQPRDARRHYAPLAKKALVRLGFDTDDSASNFKTERHLGEPPDLDKLADFMLRTLHDGYGARAEMSLRFTAPFARQAPKSCAPTS